MPTEGYGSDVDLSRKVEENLKWVMIEERLDICDLRQGDLYI